MRKNLIAMMAAFLMLGSICYAQEEVKHMDFKGIPMDGDLSSYITKLNQKGFKTTSVEEEAAILKGQFAGEDVELAVYSTPRSKMVYMVVVVFPEQSSWYSIKADFKKLENNLEEKYGAPTLQRKSFDSPYYEGDGYEMSAVRLDKCNYFSRFLTEDGEINIMILKSKKIGLYYVDKVNDAKRVREKNSSVYEDL